MKFLSELQNVNIESLVPVALNPTYGQQIVTTTEVSPFRVLNLCGCTRVNLLGRYGNCEAITNVASVNNTIALDTTRFTTGSNSIKATKTSGTSTVTPNTNIYPAVGDYYIGIFDAYLENVATQLFVNFGLSGVGYGTNKVVTTYASGYGINTIGSFVPIIAAFQVASVTTANVSNFNVQAYHIGTSGNSFNVDSFRVYKISSTEYNALGTGVTLTQAQAIADQYPYVDDVKHANSPYIIRTGENMSPSFDQWIIGGGGSATWLITDPYKISVTTTAPAIPNNEWAYIKIPVLPNQQYTFGISLNAGAGYTICDDTGGISVVAWTTNSTSTFNTGALTNIRVYIGNMSAGVGAYTFTNPRLNIGAVDKGFKPRNDSYLYFPNISLASSVDGTTYDQLFERDSKWFKETLFVRDMVLDGSLPWVMSVDYTGFKRFIMSFTSAVPRTGTVVKYDGKILPNNSSADTVDTHTVDSSNFYITIADTDSGWGETYVPSAGEIKAYFYGWKLYDSVTITNSSTYSSGTKKWACKDVATGSWVDGTTTLPTTYPASSRGYKPYKLTYQRATPTFEEIAFEGGLSVLDGGNQIEVGNGVIVREEVYPTYNGTGQYVIGSSTIPASLTKYRISRVLEVYKNGLRDDNWTIDSTNAYGLVKPSLLTALYDPNATYEMTYIAFDQYALTSNIQTINGEYYSNIKMALENAIQEQSNIATRVSAMENAVFDNIVSAMSATHSISQNVLSNTYSKIIYNSENFDNLLEHDTITGLFTAKKSGIYSVSASISFNLLSGIECQLCVYLNGALNKVIGHQRQGSNGLITVGGTTTIKVTAGQSIGIYAFHLAAATTATNTDPVFSNLQITRIA